METYTYRGLQLRKQLDSLEDIIRVVITEVHVVDSDFDFSCYQVLRGELQAS